jgi:hypothetical protein
MKLILFLFILLPFPFYSQQEKSRTTIGLELLGVGGLFSMTYTTSIYHKNYYDLELRPQFTLFPGSIEGGIPNYCAPYLGLNQRLGNEKICIVLNSAVGVGLTWGSNPSKPKFISALTIGPKYRFNSTTYGLGYTYFLSEPEYMGWSIYPHSIAIALEIDV